MKIKVELLQAFLEKYKITGDILACDIGISENEMAKLLSGKAVDKATAYKFIDYFGADKAVSFIDWEAIGKVNPFEADENTLEQGYVQKIAYILLKKPDGSTLLYVPLYVKVSRLNKSGMTDTQETLIHCLSETMIKHYEQQITAHFAKLRNEKRSKNIELH